MASCGSLVCGVFETLRTNVKLWKKTGSRDEFFGIRGIEPRYDIILTEYDMIDIAM